MKTQISRITFDPSKRYSGVYQQMGRMLTDADWNELADLVKHRLADAMTDAIGGGAPRGRGMVAITQNPDGTETARLKWGHVYVDGIPAQVRPAPDAVLDDPTGQAFEYVHQADFPDPPTPEGDHRLYVDVWERTVLTLEDGDLLDPGLHGADTCTRTQTMAQVKWCPTDVDPEDPDQNPPIGDARLTLALREGAAEPDPCDPCAEEIALRDDIGDYLFRVEIHDVEYTGFGEPRAMTLKWSSENAGEQYAIGEEPPGFASDACAYEFYSGESEDFASEMHLGKHLALAFSPVRFELTDGYPASGDIPANTSLVRRWDGFCKLTKSGPAWRLDEGFDRGVPLSTGIASDAHGYVAEGATLGLHLDAMTLTLKLADHPLLAGDFWQAAVRQAIPQEEHELPTDAPPMGIRHHYLTLGTVSGETFTPYRGDACKRFEFPPLTDIRAGDVCYDNRICDMPETRTVQDALDYLCRERDLRWHNKHLHGWGIVCGLIAECGPDTYPDPNGDGDEQGPARRQVRITPGYALTCEGEDIILGQDRIFDLLSRIEALQETGEPVLEDGDGTVLLRLDHGPEGGPAVTVEPYDPEVHDKPLWDDTLLMDFYENCIRGLFEAVTDELQFLDAEEIEAVEGGAAGLVSVQRRKLTSLLNLILQFWNTDNGGYVFLSYKEHLILRDIYLDLRRLLQSKTYCAMFRGDDFPDYPFRNRNATTFFGKNSHTRARLNTKVDRVYTYGGTDNTINIYDARKEELIKVLEMPSAEGAETSAIAFSPDGELLYAAAVVRGVDTVFGISRIGDDHKWEEMTILCDVRITEMAVSEDDKGLIYAVGLGRGLFYLRPALLMDETKARPEPTYKFNASGHMAIDPETRTAYCTVREAGDEDKPEPLPYNGVAICDLNPEAAEDGVAPPVMDLIDANGQRREGEDGLAIRPAGNERKGGRLYIVTEGDKASKHLLTYFLPLNIEEPQPMAILNIENTHVALAYHTREDRLLLALEDGYRLRMVQRDGKGTQHFRIPVQIQPVDVIVHPKSGRTYALNFVSNTLTAIPAKELEVDERYLSDLAEYRNEILAAFYRLAGGLLQYLKDCFCHHLLVKCPDCGDDDVIYLATVEIRDRRIEKICNFDKRKYVKSFPTIDYWFSLIPIWKLLKEGVSRICCLAIPNIFDRYRETAIQKPSTGAMTHKASPNFIKAGTTRTGIRQYQRADFGAVWRNQAKGIQLTGKLAKDSAFQAADIGPLKKDGIRKQSLMDSAVPDAVKELEKNNIEVTAVKEYKPEMAGSHITQYLGTPQRIDPGGKVTLYQQDGKVMFYAMEEEEPAAVTGVSETTKAELAALERRKESLKDLSEVRAELAKVENRREDVARLTAVKTELSELQAEKASAASELAALKSQVESVRAERKEETQKLAEMDATRKAISDNISAMNSSLTELQSMHKEIRVEIAKDRPVGDVSGITPEVDSQLKEMGIRTVGELSKAKVESLTARLNLEADTANSIIESAKARIKR